ncbi:hypothetical protein N7486_010088 [Penicillium sp. IBT 16267x]|nr:hypothetical protein N7486_010088 [Penicillium sp. IBT 16267x]
MDRTIPLPTPPARKMNVLNSDSRKKAATSPPVRAPGRVYEDEHLVHTSGPLVAPDRRRRRDESLSFAPPRLIRRQSSLRPSTASQYAKWSPFRGPERRLSHHCIGRRRVAIASG